MSSYPQAFQIPCLCNSTCKNNFCHCTSPKCKCTSSKQQMGYFTTTHCQPFGPPTNVIQSNIVETADETKHVWTNQRGYGNIVIATIDNKNNVVGSVSPWNRIPSLTYPTDTNVKPSNAWSNHPH